VNGSIVGIIGKERNWASLAVRIPSPYNFFYNFFVVFEKAPPALNGGSLAQPDKYSYCACRLGIDGGLFLWIAGVWTACLPPFTGDEWSDGKLGVRVGRHREVTVETLTERASQTGWEKQQSSLQSVLSSSFPPSSSSSSSPSSLSPTLDFQPACSLLHPIHLH